MLEAIKKGISYNYSYVFTQKILHFAQILILARLLTPYDFGLAAIIILVFGAANTLFQSGIKKAIIHYQLTDRASLDTGWSFSILRGLCLFVILFFSAPYIAVFFERNDIVLVTQIIAFNFVIAGFVNMGMLIYTIELKFKKVVIWEFTGFFLGVIVTIISAYIFRSYWAIIFGLMTEKIVRCISSYYFSNYRPRFNLDIGIFLKLFKYGKWMAADKIVSFATANQDKAFIGKVLGAQTLGLYSITIQLGEFLSSIYSSLSKVFFPVFSKIHKNSTVDPKKIELYLLLIISTSIPLVTIISFYSEIIVNILYGEKWIMIGPFLKIFIWASLFKIIQSALFPYLNGIGKPEYVLYINITRIILLFPSLYILINFHGIIGAISAILIVQASSLLLIFFFLNKATGFSFIRLLYSIFPLILSICVCLAFEKIFISTSVHIELIKPILSFVVLLLLTLLFLRTEKIKKYIQKVFSD
jgi:O-antigen/teichoic acid export membrane protein